MSFCYKIKLKDVFFFLVWDKYSIISLYLFDWALFSIETQKYEHFYLKIIILLNYIMDIDTIKDNYRYLIINTKNNDHFLLKTERNVSELLKNTYDITLSHMYIRRNLKNNDEYILTDGILIKMIW